MAPPFPVFDFLSDHGFAKRPTGSTILSDQGSTYWRVTGWRHSSSPRGYFPTGITDSSEPRFRMTLSLTVFDLAALSFGPVAVGLSAAIPPSADNTQLTGPFAGVRFQADTDNNAFVSLEALWSDGASTFAVGNVLNVNSYVAGVSMNIDIYINEVTGNFTARVDGQESVASLGGADLNEVWTYVVVGTYGIQAGTSGAADTSTNYEIRFRELELGHVGQMPVDPYNEKGSISPMVMG